jgi:hypothetical protein
MNQGYQHLLHGVGGGGVQAQTLPMTGRVVGQIFKVRYCGWLTNPVERG